MNNDELIAAGHELAKCLDSNTPLTEIAKLITRLATALDVTTLAVREATKQRDELAADNAALKAGPQGFFAYGSECGYEEFETAEKAMEFAEAEIADYREQACDGWSDEVGSVVWGIIMQRASMTGLRPVKEDDNAPSHIEEFCDYALLPNIETPATDAFLREVRASAVDAACLKISKSIASCRQDEMIGLDEAVNIASDFATELRKGGAE
ncbi:hypothetical protein AGJ25_08475 [Cronobacter sakazakii]|nr:hypothetical protein [Cronobacter sakazakii]EGT5751227.1 hypothetical protein [Cronobacter sakazakii]